MKKTCPKCLIEKPLVEFKPNKAKASGFSSWCRLCSRASQRSYYQRNKQKFIYQRSLSRQRRRELVSTLKNVPCADCKISYPYYVMEFDHTSDNKVGNVGTLATRVGLEALLKEIDKCEVVCANCHRERTYRRRQAPLD